MALLWLIARICSSGNILPQWVSVLCNSAVGGWVTQTGLSVSDWEHPTCLFGVTKLPITLPEFSFSEFMLNWYALKTWILLSNESIVIAFMLTAHLHLSCQNALENISLHSWNEPQRTFPCPQLVWPIKAPEGEEQWFAQGHVDFELGLKPRSFHFDSSVCFSFLPSSHAISCIKCIC